MATVVTTNAINHHILACVLIVLFYLINKLFSPILLLNSGHFTPCGEGFRCKDQEKSRR